MDRFYWSNDDESFVPGESVSAQQRGVSLYDGDEKTSFKEGILILTTHRLLWKDGKDRNRVLAMPLSLVVYLEEQPSGFAKSAKIIVHVLAAPSSRPSGPVYASRNNFIKLSFKMAGEREFHQYFNEQLKQKKWEETLPPASFNPMATAARHRAGIMGIERILKKKQQDTDKNISLAFEDLTKLIEKAKDMVNLSKTIASKIKDKQGEITEDETIRFKSYLLSMGIPNPVTKDTHGNGDKYYQELAKQLASVLEKPIKENGGIMTLSDVYCRVNRARGMELLSPEDLLNACELLELMQLPVRLKTFDSGVMVLQLRSHDEEKVMVETTEMVNSKGSLTAEELARLQNISVVLGKEWLLLTENKGGICRDESIEGLRFYPNLFLTKT